MNSRLLPQLIQAYPFLEEGNLQLTPFGEGLIHETLLLKSQRGTWILQGFNDSVFNYPERIDHNLRLLDQETQGKKLPFKLPLPILNQINKGLTELERRKFRLFEFVEGVTLQQIQAPSQAFLAAQAYGVFADWAKDLDAQAMQESIPDFHRLDLRFEKLRSVLAHKQALTAEETALRDFYLSQKPLIDWYLDQIQHLPLRVTHNDTKINNLIFSENLEKVNALIDLDTVMGGYLMYDFGDLVRTVACSLPETSTEWASLKLIPYIFEELLRGYWESIQSFSTPKESRSILLGGEVMTLIMGLRFFTDHLQGNIYYRVSYPEQNFHRAKNQMLFLQSQQALRPQLQEIWKKITGIPD
ncbi:aminoglycoside phosphotransferase family protein [Algoriphagus confluentis]|uniref:Aminoglycoside phosphotransferase family protein n=1 Tax=Algoriphagus confluentis TaxID=1697556 RepID=A0ABQ6PLD3_9BACT|nr:aminoglycoside phosphotransferase family protein [Algoriphagus confluentis]